MRKGRHRVGEIRGQESGEHGTSEAGHHFGQEQLKEGRRLLRSELGQETEKLVFEEVLLEGVSLGETVESASIGLVLETQHILSSELSLQSENYELRIGHMLAI